MSHEMKCFEKNGMTWKEWNYTIRWCDMKSNHMKYSEYGMKWIDMKWYDRKCCVMKWFEMIWCDSEMIWMRFDIIWSCFDTEMIDMKSGMIWSDDQVSVLMRRDEVLLDGSNLIWTWIECWLILAWYVMKRRSNFDPYQCRNCLIDTVWYDVTLWIHCSSKITSNMIRSKNIWYTNETVTLWIMSHDFSWTPNTHGVGLNNDDDVIE